MSNRTAGSYSDNIKQIMTDLEGNRISILPGEIQDRLPIVSSDRGTAKVNRMFGEAILNLKGQNR